MSTVKLTTTGPETSVQSPAEPIPFNSRLVSKVNRRHLTHDAHLSAIQLTAGWYFIKCELTVSGAMPVSARLPGLSVECSALPYGNDTGTAPRTVTGTAIHGIEDDDTISSSVSIDHDGLSTVNIRLSGTSRQPHHDWSFSADVSVYRIQ